MSKQTIEIEVPEGKKAIWKDGKVVFVDSDDWRNITTFSEAKDYLEKNKLCLDLINSYESTSSGSYEETLAKYRIVVAALTRNEKRYLTKGECWYPIVQFCRLKDIKNCWGSHKIGYIKSGGEKYTVVGGRAHNGSLAGLGSFDSYNGVSCSGAHVGFRSVFGKEVAEHISKYFGKLLFQVHYGGTNCDWEWIDE